ncbi:MAG: PEP-utilizing enzyme [Candidatus Paceibacterota bacterium]|jgi:phosphohistidine swiveling domain-containing protein
MADKEILSVDWQLWIQRKGLDIFSVSLFHIEEEGLLRAVIGGGTSKQLCVCEGDDYLFIRSTSDFAQMYNDIAAFIRKQPLGYFEKVFEKARTMPEVTRDLIKRVSGYSDTEVVENFQNITDDIMAVILYNTSIPYFLLSTLETHADIPPAHYDLLMRESEKLRATSLFHDLMTSVYGRIFDVLSRRFGVERAHASFLSVEEMADMVNGKAAAPSANELVAREKCVVWMDKTQNRTLFSYDEGLREEIKERVWNQLKPRVDASGASLLKGNTAFGGKVSGAVKIVTSAATMAKMARGDILVAHTTNPSLMQAISLAGAIVTDEGGIGCHAAIVARELKVPCIIGTRIATQVLHDGDMVEVDANNGVVRIIKGIVT